MKLGCVIAPNGSVQLICGSSSPTPHRLTAVVGTACEVNKCGGSEVKAQLWEDLIIGPLEPTAKTKNKTKTKTYRFHLPDFNSKVELFSKSEIMAAASYLSTTKLFTVI